MNMKMVPTPPIAKDNGTPSIRAPTRQVNKTIVTYSGLIFPLLVLYSEPTVIYGEYLPKIGTIIELTPQKEKF